MNIKNYCRIIKVIGTAIILSITSPFCVHAFGISPPQVINDRLVPGAHFEQNITLSRTDTDKEVSCKVEMDTPGFSDWITVEPGQQFMIDQGEKISQLNIKVDVPKDAKPGRNKGTIRVTVTPEKEIGKVNIVLGARINVDLTVTDEKISNFTIKQVTIPDLEEKWKVMATIKLENNGNVKAAPDRVTLDVYDGNYQKLIKSAKTTKIEQVNPFQTKEIFTYFGIPLAIGQYWGDVKVYKAGAVIWEEKAIFNVQPKGTLPAQPKEPLFVNIDPKQLWLIAIGIISLAIIAIAVIAIRKFTRSKRKH